MYEANMLGKFSGFHGGMSSKRPPHFGQLPMSMVNTHMLSHCMVIISTRRETLVLGCRTLKGATTGEKPRSVNAMLYIGHGRMTVFSLELNDEIIPFFSWTE